MAKRSSQLDLWQCRKVEARLPFVERGLTLHPRLRALTLSANVASIVSNSPTPNATNHRRQQRHLQAFSCQHIKQVSLFTTVALGLEPQHHLL